MKILEVKKYFSKRRVLALLSYFSLILLVTGPAYSKDSDEDVIEVNAYATLYNTGEFIELSPGDKHPNTKFIQCGFSTNEHWIAEIDNGDNIQFTFSIAQIPPAECSEPHSSSCPIDSNTPICDKKTCVCGGVSTADDCEYVGGHCDVAWKLNGKFLKPDCHIKEEVAIGDCNGGKRVSTGVDHRGRTDEYLLCCKDPSGRRGTQTPGGEGGPEIPESHPDGPETPTEPDDHEHLPPLPPAPPEAR